ncbi:triose-phosphate transporter family-domain-containing protein [Dichotomocladium elegans]|nr:triose-phosphate transporter family-domain-containing protein [Dichotomocladium elegans]
MPENTVVAAYCALWYACSAMTSNSGKQILDVFPFPVTLTFVQFGLVGLQCYATAALSNKTRIRSLNTQFIISMVPLSLFLVGGHVFTSVAMSRIPVSLVHTVKALSPLFTVFIYRFLFQAKYTSRVYVSLLPLITGVVLTCTFTLSTNWIGIVCAFLSCLVFVAQNIYNKKVLFEGDHKLPRLQILCYLSSMAFFAMLPLWIYTDGAKLVAPETDTPLPVWLFVLNGITNFGQSYFAFATLEKTSPVTYSIASLIKRIVVIVVSILWFGQEVSFAQAVGIFLTFVGLWMYQNAKSDVDRGEARAREKSLEILPTANRVPVEHRHRFPMLHGQWRLWNNTTVRNEKTK